ncbi:Endonuclease/exonuclease/phosphatase [Parasponia andersonii]|uniref:Endonuclease/exonuclease/phosphatase n=1 Tax=Parasponia andersonii TaxID=3476 RepID=A0A2P5DA64_PARAD|nr:Endonuclease/exonuclease/phosphatase [Parasponia andersonii]
MVASVSPDCLVLSETMIGENVLSWKNSVDFEPWFVSKNVICGTILSDSPNCPWSIIVVYGPPTTADKRRFWESLPSLLDRIPGRGNQGSSSSSLALWECCSTLGLTDLGSQGPQFTWGRRRGRVLFQPSLVLTELWPQWNGRV